MSLVKFEMDDEQKLQLMKDTICKGSTNEEFELFAYTCKRLGLDPFAKQVYPVKRWDSALKREAMTIQTSIDGYRLIAERTGRYAPGKEPEFGYDKDGNLVWAKAHVKKQTADGTWHEVAATAHYREYAALKKDGTPTHMWYGKPHIMLAKCAEALALRKAFPAELSGAYTEDEMQQADNPVIPVEPKNTECSIQEYEQFVMKWGLEYGETIILDYLTKRSEAFDKTERETVSELMKDENGTKEELEKFIKKYYSD